VPTERIAHIESELRYRVAELPGIRQRIEDGELLTDDDVRTIVALARATI